MSYKIPTGLNQNFGDMEIALQSKSGMGATPLHVRMILIYVVSILALFLICSKSFLSVNPGFWIPFALCWILSTFLLTKTDKTKRMYLESIPALLAYIPKPARKVIVRKDRKANDFISICSIDSLDPNTGVVKYIDGTYGLFYRVVGAASILLFDEDRTAIIDRVDSFWRKIGTECEIEFVTTKEAQKIYKQLANLGRRYDALESRDPDMNIIFEEQFQVLKNDIGGVFKSIHQYMFIKADNEEMLVKNRNVIESEFENSTLMFKQCIPLDYNDLCGMLATIYSSS